MIETSDTYKRLLAADARAEVALAIGQGPVITNEDGKILIFGDTSIAAGVGPDRWLRENDLSSITITQRAVGDDSPSVGGAYSGEIEVVLVTTDADIPKQAELRPYVRLTDGAETSEWVPQGVFFVDTRSLDAQEGLPKLTLRGYDAMLRAEQDYPESEIQQWPATDLEIVEEIAKTIRVSLDGLTRDMIDRGYPLQYPDGYCCREVLAEIAGMYGGNFSIGIDGALRLVPLLGTEDAVDIGTAILGDYSSGDPITWNRVELDLDDTVYLTAGDGDSVLRLNCVNGTKAIAADLLSRFENAVYQPFTAAGALLDPAAELGDRVTIPGTTGVLLWTTRYLGPMYTADLESPENEDIDHEYPYASGSDRKQLRRYLQTKNEIDELKNKVEKLTKS